MSTTPAPVRRLVGDCLYNAVADALGESAAAIDYRERTANYIQAFYQEHPDEFADKGINAHELWETVLTSQKWDNDSGDHIPEFLALALDIHMIIHAGDSLYDMNPNGQRIIHLLLEDNHYTVYPILLSLPVRPLFPPRKPSVRRNL